MSNELVTVVIPVYKTRQYMDECIDSVLAQDYPELEIILVDDGSPDECPERCDWYAEQYEQIKAVHQKNQGLGMARNTGLEAATGKYITFLDSDDCLDGSGAIRSLVEEAEKAQADIVIGAYRRFDDKEVSGINHHYLQGGSYTRTADFRFKGFYLHGHLSYDWGKLYRCAFLTDNGIKCRAYPFTQDKPHNMVCCVYQPVYAFIEESVYRYRINEKSVTFKYKENLMPVWFAIAEDFEQFLTANGFGDEYHDLTAYHFFFGMFFLVKQELQAKKHGIIESAKVLSKYGQNELVGQRMKELSKGKYLRDIEPITWKITIRVISWLFCVHAYHLLALGMAILRKTQIDGIITKSRYKS